MQQAVTLMRRPATAGVIAIPGVDYANDLSALAAREPRDPLNQLVAEAHVYGKQRAAPRPPASTDDRARSRAACR